MALSVEAIAFDDRRGRTVLSGPDFRFDLGRTSESPPPRLLALRGDDCIRLPGVYVASSHRSGLGRAWVANVAPDRLPEPPFFLTNDEVFRSVFRARVSFRLSLWAPRNSSGTISSGRPSPSRATAGSGSSGSTRTRPGPRAPEAFSREAATFTPGERTARWAGRAKSSGRF